MSCRGRVRPARDGLLSVIAVAALLFLSPATVQSACLVEGGAPGCGSEPDPGSNDKRTAKRQHVGNPIDLVAGNKYQAGFDYRSHDSPLVLSRHYNSSLIDHDLGLGRGWRHTYDVVLTKGSDGSFRIVQSDGRMIRFSGESLDHPPTGSDGHDVLPGESEALHAAAREADGFLAVGKSIRWHLPDGRRLTFHGSWLIKIDYPAGQSLSMHYRMRRLHQVVDDLGKTLTFNYIDGARSLGRFGEPDRVPAGHLAFVELPDGSTMHYGYDRNLNLISATDVAENRLDYRYGDERWPSHLTAIAERGVTLAAWTYDKSGRADGWVTLGQGGRGLITYVDDARTSSDGTTRVLYENGSRWEYTWTTDVDRSHYVTDADELPGRLSREEVREAFAAAEGLPGYSELLPKSIRADRSVQISASSTRTHAASKLDSIVEVQVSLGESPPISLSVTFDRTGSVHDVRYRGLSMHELVEAADRMPDRERVIDKTAAELGTIEERLEALQSADVESLVTPDSIEITILTLVDLAFEVDRDIERQGRSELPLLREQIDPAGPVCPLPNGINCDAIRDQRELGYLSACAYSGAVCQTGFRSVDPTAIGMRTSDFVVGGLPVQLYHDGANDRYVLAFRGTENARDAYEDFRNAAGMSSDQYTDAARLAEQLNVVLQRESPGSDLAFTGHSLGGGLASIAALRTLRPATVFNSASVTRGTAHWNGLDLDELGFHVHSAQVDGEPISVGQRFGGILNWFLGGRTGTSSGPYPGDASPWSSTLPQPSESWIIARNGGSAPNPIGRRAILHSMDAVLFALDYLIAEHCVP